MMTAMLMMMMMMMCKLTRRGIGEDRILMDFAQPYGSGSRSSSSSSSGGGGSRWSRSIAEEAAGVLTLWSAVVRTSRPSLRRVYG